MFRCRVTFLPTINSVNLRHHKHFEYVILQNVDKNLGNCHFFDVIYNEPNNNNNRKNAQRKMCTKQPTLTTMRKLCKILHKSNLQICWWWLFEVNNVWSRCFTYTRSFGGWPIENFTYIWAIAVLFIERQRVKNNTQTLIIFKWFFFCMNEKKKKLQCFRLKCRYWCFQPFSSGNFFLYSVGSRQENHRAGKAYWK